MFSNFPQWDARIGNGQRSSQDESTAIVFASTDLALSGDGANGVTPLRLYSVGSSGTVNVHSHIATAYIEKFVYRVGMAEAAIVQRSLDPGPLTLATVQREEPG